MPRIQETTTENTKHVGLEMAMLININASGKIEVKRLNIKKQKEDKMKKLLQFLKNQDKVYKLYHIWLSTSHLILRVFIRLQLFAIFGFYIAFFSGMVYLVCCLA